MARAGQARCQIPVSQRRRPKIAAIEVFNDLRPQPVAAELPHAEAPGEILERSAVARVPQDDAQVRVAADGGGLATCAVQRLVTIAEPALVPAPARQASRSMPPASSSAHARSLRPVGPPDSSRWWFAAENPCDKRSRATQSSGSAPRRQSPATTPVRPAARPRY